jgi:exosome complex exonuclease DIS3/RRP44
MTLKREHYLRDDIVCGHSACTPCATLASEADAGNDAAALRLDAAATQRVLVVDTNIALHQMDLLEHAGGAFDNVVYLQTMLDEVRHRDHRIYSRCRVVTADAARRCIVFSNEHHRSTYVERRTGEIMNDRNDRAIRVAAQWYARHLATVDADVEVVMLSDDADNRARAHAEGLKALSMREYVALQADAHPDLGELLSQVTAANDAATERENVEFASHLSEAAMKSAVARGACKEGTFKVNRSYWGEGVVVVRGGFGGDSGDGEDVQVLIPGLANMNRATDGDTVVIKLLPRSAWTAPATALPDATTDAAASNGAMDDKGQDIAVMPETTSSSNAAAVPTGTVVGIVQRAWRPYAGCLEETDKESGTVLFVAMDKKIPKVRIETKRIQELMDKRIVVVIDSWPQQSRYPLGHYSKTIGTMGDRDTETQCLLMEHDVPDLPWTDAVLACLPRDDYTISEHEVKNRLDLRESHEVFSVDPPGCTDIDDALHCRILPNGNYEVGVHIADVTHYIKPETPLDDEAAFRATSVYLVERRIDMIPGFLSGNLCSLHEKVDRLTFSCIWEMTPDAVIVDTKFKKCVIRSVGAFSYGQAQTRIDDANDFSSITMATRRLNDLAKIMKKRRIAEGALTLASPQIKFLLDENREKPLAASVYELKEANSMIEEFMLLANIAVAKQTLTHFPAYACLRRHPTPQPKQFEPLVKAAAQSGFEINIESSKALADSLDACIVPGHDYFNTLIRIMATRCMTQAVYFSSGDLPPEEYRHFGLAAEIYTHFTSPIRRYADMIVHRLLANSIGWDPLPETLQDSARVRVKVDNINHRHRAAQQAGRASTDLYTLFFFRDRAAEEEEALISSVRSNGIRVIVPKYGLEGSIRLVSKDDEEKIRKKQMGKTYEYDDKKLSLTSTAAHGATFRMFESVRVIVRVEKSKLRREWLVTELVDATQSSSQASTPPANAPKQKKQKVTK